jgi:ribonuclease HII
MPKTYPTLDEEHRLMRAGHITIAGLDEAGRGAWAGPVAAAAVILPLDDPTLSNRLRGVCDSKLCTARQRETFYEQIGKVALSWAAVLVSASRIDETGIVPCTRQAMREAIAHLDPPPDALLIDALKLPTIPLPARSLIKGDLKSLTIACASILAKVTRDREMVTLGELYPGYGFAQHKGYGTPQHRQALHTLGPVGIHRWSFAPVAAVARELDSPQYTDPSSERVIYDRSS